MRISDWSSDVCSSDLHVVLDHRLAILGPGAFGQCRAGVDTHRAIDDALIVLPGHDDALAPGVDRLEGEILVFGYRPEIRNLGVEAELVGGAEGRGQEAALALHRRIGMGERKSTRLNSSH